MRIRKDSKLHKSLITEYRGYIFLKIYDPLSEIVTRFPPLFFHWCQEFVIHAPQKSMWVKVPYALVTCQRFMSMGSRLAPNYMYADPYKPDTTHVLYSSSNFFIRHWASLRSVLLLKLKLDHRLTAFGKVSPTYSCIYCPAQAINHKALVTVCDVRPPNGLVDRGRRQSFMCLLPHTENKRLI